VKIQKPIFTSFVKAALAATPINRLLEDNAAIVIERIAGGGGATNWFLCSNKSQLGAIEPKLSPGSVVSFYLDGRIRRAHYSPELKLYMEKIIAETGEIVFGLLREDGLQLDVEFVSGPLELAEVSSRLDGAAWVFYGAFPARDNDGVCAVTVTLPDEDGVVRPHPH
jgi:hypothetical protein